MARNMAVKTKTKKCVRFVGKIFEKGKALLARILFIIHGIIAIWRVTDVYQDPLYFILCIPMGALIGEFILTSICTDGEWKWFCPSVFLYLLSVVPGVWLLQLDVYYGRIAEKERAGLDECGYSTINSTALREINGVSIPIELSSDEWALALEQILLILLIVGRWMLPKGKLTRDQLSQLLLVYIGIAADSLEFSLESLKEQSVLCNFALTVLILSIWSWSLLQFCLVMTAVAAPKPRVATGKRERSFCGGCIENEIWALMMSVVLQDAPYLVMRLYLMIHYRAINQMMLFFTCKNLMVVLLQFYRMAILCGGGDDDDDDDGDDEIKGRQLKNGHTALETSMCSIDVEEAVTVTEEPEKEKDK